MNEMIDIPTVCYRPLHKEEVSVLVSLVEHQGWKLFEEILELRAQERVPLAMDTTQERTTRDRACNEWRNLEDLRQFRQQLYSAIQEYGTF